MTPEKIIELSRDIIREEFSDKRIKTCDLAKIHKSIVNISHKLDFCFSLMNS
jgi:hypothetical protein